MASEWVIELADIVTAGNYTCTIVPPAPPPVLTRIHISAHRTHTLNTLRTHMYYTNS